MIISSTSSLNLLVLPFVSSEGGDRHNVDARLGAPVLKALQLGMQYYEQRLCYYLLYPNFNY
jgi:hypothetical protein